jgi:hypothetical protein
MLWAIRVQAIVQYYTNPGGRAKAQISQCAPLGVQEVVQVVMLPRITLDAGVDALLHDFRIESGVLN